jgi:hypothetical protein
MGGLEMEKPETIGEYYVKLREFVLETIDKMPEDWFTAKEFREEFMRVEKIHNYSCVTPYRSSGCVGPLWRRGMEGGRAFTDWRDRSYNVLRIRVKWGLLEEIKDGNRIYFRKKKGEK